MRRHVIRALDALPVLHAGSVATIGVFDGLHLGHQSILARLLASARERGLPAVCVTFSVHPREVLAGTAPRHILSLEHRLELLAARGVDDVVVIEFSREVAATEPEAFVEQLLVRRLGVRELVIGHDTAIGHARRGDAAFLAEAGRHYGFHVVAVGGVVVDGEVVSSTAVRAAIAAGDLPHAARLLGRPVSLLGTVVRGDGRGAQLGFPTANLEVRSEAFPPLGVYAVTARSEQGDLPAVMNYGLRPTFHQDDSHAVFEVHVLDREDLDLYGQRMEVFLHEFLRRERRFDNAAQLKLQIAEDCRRAARASRPIPPVPPA
ncbi:MAG TPA: riboflavin biosynthesis protein RibF [Kofleriaceae bacterium]|nr:riboflavin biosynthesis protein RibF [Kofleriaceae bacterium]